MHVQRIKSMGNRQTFHPKNLDYDIFNIEIDIGPVDLLLHGLLLRKLWWLKVKHRQGSLGQRALDSSFTGESLRLRPDVSRHPLVRSPTRAQGQRPA